MAKTKTITKTCENCGKTFEAESTKARWCSDACKMKNYRKLRDARGGQTDGQPTGAK